MPSAAHRRHRAVLTMAARVFIVRSNEHIMKDTLDLHGFTKAQGIAALTQFLDQVKTKNRDAKKRAEDGEIWVQIITGSGAHSGFGGGPVLRDAVQSLLVKRNMIFKLNRGKGSFNVKANSGHELFKSPPPTDTKVIVRKAPENIPALPKTACSYACLGDAGFAGVDPLPAEVSASDANLKESQDARVKLELERQREEKMVNDAVARSLETDNNDGFEESLLQEAMSLSMQDLQQQQQLEQEDRLKCDNELQEALKKSEKEYTDREKDVDFEIQEAMQMSQRESTPEDTQWMEVLEASRKEFVHQMEAEEGVLQDSLEQASALSLNPAASSQ